MLWLSWLVGVYLRRAILCVLAAYMFKGRGDVAGHILTEELFLAVAWVVNKSVFFLWISTSVP